MTNKKQRPTDINQRAKLLVDIATGEKKEIKSNKNKANAAMGRLGGLIGGKIRARNLSSEQRTNIAKKAAQVRWKKI